MPVVLKPRQQNGHRLIIETEGPEKAVALWLARPDAEVWCALGCANMGKASPNAGDQIVIAADHGPAGTLAADRAKQAYRRRGCHVSVIFPTDSKDWDEMPTADVAAAIDGAGSNEQHTGADDRRYRFHLVPFSQIKLDNHQPYIVKGLVPREGLVLVWGPPKCGKSFVVFDVSMHIAFGWAYRGRRVRQCGVVYVACEGERGLSTRVEAFRKAKLDGIDEAAPFYLLTTRLSLKDDWQELVDDIRAQIGDINPGVIVIDTLNRALVGSESSDEDMGNFIKAADAIREAFRCAVVVIHHCGIEGTRPRGHTSLTGAVDAQLAVKRSESGVITVEVEWMKDGDSEGDQIVSRLETVEVGTDTDGDPITSCVVEIAEEAEAVADERKAKFTGPAKIALDILKNAVLDVGQMPPANKSIPTGVLAIQGSIWRERCYFGGLTSSDDLDTRRKTFNRAYQNLLSRGAIGVWDTWVWPAI